MISSHIPGPSGPYLKIRRGLCLTSSVLDAIASPSSYPNQWDSEWLIVSDLEIAITCELAHCTKVLKFWKSPLPHGVYIKCLNQQRRNLLSVHTQQNLNIRLVNFVDVHKIYICNMELYSNVGFIFVLKHGFVFVLKLKLGLPVFPTAGMRHWNRICSSMILINKCEDHVFKYCKYVKRSPREIEMLQSLQKLWRLRCLAEQAKPVSR